MIAAIVIFALFAEPAALTDSVLLAQQTVQEPVAQFERNPPARPSPDRGAVLAQLLARM